MILVYTTLLFLLGTLKFLVGRRVAALERRYGQVAKEADRFVRELPYRGGNTNKPDPYLTAKRQYLLGLLVQKRDRLEAKYTTWQGLSERLGRTLQTVGNWKGKKLPYTFGVLDVSALMVLVDHLGVGEVMNVRHLVQLVQSLMTN